MTPPDPAAVLAEYRLEGSRAGWASRPAEEVWQMAEKLADALSQQTARVEALEAALAQRGKDGAIGRIYPAHLVEWAKQIRREQHYDSALTSWLERLGTEWAALAPVGPGEEK